MSVLVVDSDPMFRHKLVNHLLICGVETFEVVSSGRAAQKKMLQNVFDVALINFSLPDIPGLQLARELQNHKPDSKIFMVMDENGVESFKSAAQGEQDPPILLKSEVLRELPRLLSEEN